MNNVQDQAQKCANGCGFYGNPATRNMCSMCYRNFLKKSAIEAEIKPSSSHIDVNNKPTTAGSSHDDIAASSNNTCTTTSVKKTVNRCGACKKRVGLTGFECRCGGVYCGSHRHPEEHSCSIDRKEIGREALSKTLYAEAAHCKTSKLDYML